LTLLIREDFDVWTLLWRVKKGGEQYLFQYVAIGKIWKRKRAIRTWLSIDREIKT